MEILARELDSNISKISYDTVSLKKLKHSKIDDISSNLQKIKFTNNHDGSCYHTGKLNNLNVTVNNYGIFIKGSLNKYFHNNNYGELSIIETRQAIEKIEDELKLNIKDTSVGRIDVGNNYIVEDFPNNYLKLLGVSKNYIRNIDNGTLYYSNSLRKLIFYDKIKESKRHCKYHPLPPNWNGKNVLRYELCYRKRIKEKFRKQIIAADLYDPFFFNNIGKQYQEEFNKIQKINYMRPLLDQNDMTTKDYKNYLLEKHIEQMGLENILNEINLNKSIFSSHKSRQRLITEIKNPKFLKEENPLLLELKNKILI